MKTIKEKLLGKTKFNKLVNKFKNIKKSKDFILTDGIDIVKIKFTKEKDYETNKKFPIIEFYTDFGGDRGGIAAEWDEESCNMYLSDLKLYKKIKI